MQLILLVNEKTLLPVLMPLAPAATAPSRIGPEIAASLAAHQAPATLVDAELDQMRDCRLAPTANRSVVGIMTDFTSQADVYRRHASDLDLPQLSPAARSIAATSVQTGSSMPSCGHDDVPKQTQSAVSAAGSKVF